MKDLREHIIESLNEGKKYNTVDDMIKQFTKKYKITEDDLDDLMYLIHSDVHVGRKIKSLIAKVQKTGKVPKTILYRGCSDAEFEAIKANNHSFIDTLSFSEDKNIAKGFGKNLIAVEAKVPMFCYHKFLREWYTNLKNINPDAYVESDGDFIIASAEEELEWICTNDYKFTITDKKASTGEFIFSLNK